VLECGGVRRAGVDRSAGQRHGQHRRAHHGELTEQECRATLLILAYARTALACDVGSTVEDATVVRLPVPGRCSMTGAVLGSSGRGGSDTWGSPVLLARCYSLSIGLASVSRQVCGRHSLTPSGLPARAGGPGRRGCRIRSRPSAATGPARRRGTAGRAAAIGAMNPRGHVRFRIGAPGSGDDLPF
jgi:hypothetical protein